MQLGTDTEIKRWKPKGNNTRARCGPKLYVRGFETGRKLFQLRFEVDRKTNWLDVADYPQMSLSVAREIAIASGRLIKAKECTVETLRIALSKSDSAMSLENGIKAQDVEAQPTGAVPTFDELYRAWHKTQTAANRWTNVQAENRPIRGYEIHAERHIGTMPINKIRKSIIKAFMQTAFTKAPKQAALLLGYINEIFRTAGDDELIEANPCPSKAAFTIPRRNDNPHSSLHFSKLPQLMEWLNLAPFSNAVKVAMRLSVITAHRASVISNMRWKHLNLETGVWTVPERDVEKRELGPLMKSGHVFSAHCQSGSCWN